MAKRLFAFAILSFAVRAALGEPVTPFDKTQLLNLVDEQHVRSIDQLIPLLPVDFRTNVTFVADSESLQPSSPVSPRAILWSELAQMAISLNGNPMNPGYNSVEIMQAESKGESIHYYELKFPLARTNAVTSLREPSKCKACHGASPRPIWQEYPVWTKSFGNIDDFSTDEREEDFRQFKLSAQNNPRYAAFFPRSDEPGWRSGFPYRDDNIDRAGRFSTGFMQRPNLRFGAFLSRLNAHRIVALLNQHSDFAILKDAIIEKLMNCSGEASDQPTLGLLQHFGLQKSDFDFRGTYGSRDETLDFRLSYFDGVATSIEYVLAQLLGDAAPVRSLREKYSNETPRNVLDWPLFDVLDDLGKWMPLPYPRTPLTATQQKREPFTAQFRQKYQNICDKLPKGSFLSFPFERPPETSPGEQILRQHCSECHSPKGLQNFALADSDSLKALLKKYGVGLIQQIETRTNPAATYDFRMPMHRTPLTENERATLLSYLRSLSPN